MKSNLNLKALLWTFSLAAIDLIIKIITVKTLGFLKPVKIVGEYIWIIATANVWTHNTTGLKVGWTVFMLFFLFVFYRIQTRDISNGFKWASAMIVFAWLGNQVDHYFLSSESNMPEFYGNMDWFYDGVITGAVTSISTIMTNGGWIFFIIMVITKFKELRKIF